MEVASTFETSVNNYKTTLRNTPEENNLYTRRRGKLKPHQIILYLVWEEYLLLLLLFICLQEQ